MLTHRESLATTFASGFIAGAIGTTIMTVAQRIEMKLSGRGPSDAPAKGVEKLFHIDPTTDRGEQRLSTFVHFAYGSTWGIARSLLRRAGLRGAAASTVHLGAVWGAALVMLPALGLAPPVTKWSGPQIASDIALHAVYAFATGMVDDRIGR